MSFVRNGYLWILFSLVMLLVDVRHQSVDLLPDVAAYLLMIFGLYLLRRDDAGYGQLIPLAAVLSALAATNLSMEEVWFARYGDVNYFYNPLYYIEWLRMALNMVLVWRFCVVARRVATSRRLHQLAITITERAHLYMAVIPMVIGAEICFHLLPQSQFYLSPISLFSKVLAWMFLIGAVWQMSRQLGPAALEQKPTSA